MRSGPGHWVRPAPVLDWRRLLERTNRISPDPPLACFTLRCGLHGGRGRPPEGGCLCWRVVVKSGQRASVARRTEMSPCRRRRKHRPPGTQGGGRSGRLATAGRACGPLPAPGALGGPAAGEHEPAVCRSPAAAAQRAGRSAGAAALAPQLCSGRSAATGRACGGAQRQGQRWQGGQCAAVCGLGSRDAAHCAGGSRQPRGDRAQGAPCVVLPRFGLVASCAFKGACV